MFCSRTTPELLSLRKSKARAGKIGENLPSPEKRDPRAGGARGSRADRRYGEKNLLLLLLLFGLLSLLLLLLSLLLGLLFLGLGLGRLGRLGGRLGVVGPGGEGDEEQGGECSGDRADHFELLGCGAGLGIHPSSLGRSKGHAACRGG